MSKFIETPSSCHAAELLLPRIAEAFQDILAMLPSVYPGQEIIRLGLRRSARLPVLAALYSQLKRPVVLITDRSDRSLSLVEELGLWLPDVPRLFFPEPNPLFYENAAWGESTRRDRMMALTVLTSYHLPGAETPRRAPVIVASARAIMTRTLPRRDFLKASKVLRRGQEISIENLVRECYFLGYEYANTVIAPGQYTRRGGLLDLWPPAEPEPVRLEFFGNEIDTLRRFDPATQRSKKPEAGEQSNRTLLTPAREFLIKKELNSSGADPSRLVEGGVRQFTEFDIPRLHPTPASLLDYLPRQAIVLIDDLQALEEGIADIEEQAVKLRREFEKDGTLPADFPLPYLTVEEVLDALHSHQTIELGPSYAAADEMEGLETSPSTEFSKAGMFNPAPHFAGRLKSLMEHLYERYRSGETALVISRQASRLLELWKETPHQQNPAFLEPCFFDGSLSEGWIFDAPGYPPIHLLTDGEIFGWRRPEPRYRRSEHYRLAAAAPETEYADLKVDDLVVHIDHGIGRFRGLVKRLVDQIEREYFCIEYANEAQLFVPVHQADRLTRYVGADNRPPSISRLGGAEWRTTKAEVKEAVKEVAQDLLDLYARRSIIQGYEFKEDTPWQAELEASFAYIETEDQLRVLSEVKKDMQSPKPMDRLICGDVGYGKTEVALRAAFKAVMEGKQVAILVPTTVLAQQHYNTFKSRLSAFPVEVEMLSRFRTPQQQREILHRLAKGSVDIIIGTHRLLSADVKLRDLGLLIIDEEQRFGVTHKETLKKLRTEVDVLTLTATPIPRTLYLALSGIRDISTINTPPEERLPIVTHVGPYSPKLVRQAVLRELERGGQVFFVHNRVQTIDAMYAHLKKLVPEARMTIAHGQMAEHELSQRMEQFSAGDVDLLLCTSIIESGLDIPNANTLIVDRADTFGLAQLYQLRGRVGRGAQRAYAYFFRHNRLQPTPEARLRLETIAENNQLGAGFTIAMRDLEIRGTGDILGTRQHGHIAAVGFHLYTRLLADAVRKLRLEHGLESPAATGKEPALAAREAFEKSLHTVINVDLPLQSSIPVAYVPDKSVRLGLYRRIADLEDPGDIDSLAEELKDRFGPPPQSVMNLLLQVKVKILAAQAGLSSIIAENGQMALRYPENDLPDSLPNLGPYLRVGKTALWLPYASLDNWPQHLLQILEKLSSMRRTA